MSATRQRRVLAVASGGGHWVQLRRLAPALEDVERVWLTIDSSHRLEIGADAFYTVNDATRWNLFGLVLCALRIIRVLLRVRPDVIITTGAAPGFLTIAFGKVLGARTVWIDSIANAEELSGSGSRIGIFADEWLTQWPHLAKPRGPHFKGGVF